MGLKLESVVGWHTSQIIHLTAFILITILNIHHSHHHHHHHHQNSEDQNHDDIIIGWRTASSSDFLEKRRETFTRWLVGAPCRSGRYHHLHHHHHRHQHHHNHFHQHQIIYTRVTAEHSGKYTCSAGHNKVNKSVEVRLATIIIVNMMMSLGKWWW